MKKKIVIYSILGGIAAVILFLILFFSIPRVTYTYSEEHQGYLVKEAYGNAKSYTIPNEHHGKKVVGVSTRAFFRHSHLESIVFEEPENIESIGRLSFSECPNLKSIDLTYVDKIEKNAFALDSSLEEITLSAKNIGMSAFYSTGLKKVILFDGVETIGSLAFAECKALEELDLPKSCTMVGNDAFIYSGIQKVSVYSSLLSNSYIQSLDYVLVKEV